MTCQRARSEALVAMVYRPVQRDVYEHQVLVCVDLRRRTEKRLRRALCQYARRFGVYSGTRQRADLVLLDANPLTDIRNARRIRAVVLAGTLLDRPALDRLLTEALELAKRK